MTIGMSSQSVQEKIDQLNRDAWDARVSDSNHALVLSEEAVALAETTNYTKGLAEGLRTKGFSYIRLSRHKEALQLLERSLALFISLNDLRGQSDVHEYFGIIQRSLGNYEASLNALFKGLELRQQTGYREGESLSFYHLGVTYKYLGNYEQALDQFLKSLAIAHANHYWISKSYSLNNIGLIYFETEDYNNALEYFYQSLAIRNESGDKWGEAGCLDNIGFCHFKTKQFEKAADFCTQCLEISRSTGDQKGEGNALFHLGNIYEQSGHYDKALNCYNQSLQIRQQISDKKGVAETILFLAELYATDKFPEHNADKAFGLLNDALQIGNEIKANDLLGKIHHGFYLICKQHKLNEEALLHLETYINIEKEIHTATINQKILNLEISHRVEKSKQEAEIYRLRNIELASLYEEIKKRNEEIEVQKKNIEEALLELKSTQAQLIQSEKMASLGEVIAGIAHEIQNPLNFVNNFSEVNKEMLEELKAERLKPKAVRDENLEDDILNDVIANSEKINHHGKRAEAIVKGMLQHSRSSSGQKETTNINALADKYLRLAYQGLRAKDKLFNATLKTDYDESIGNINLIPQDIGRVILNLINNAFYAVNEKKKAESGKPNTEGQLYEPTLSVSTKRIGDKVFVSVKDNGNGITQKIVDKIFQPFFTTKPTGQGTGLGLSLSYDIVKAHRGEIKVESKEGEGSEFIIQLLLNSTS